MQMLLGFLIVLVTPFAHANPFTMPVPRPTRNSSTPAFPTIVNSTAAAPTGVVPPSGRPTGHCHRNGTATVSVPKVTPPPAGGSFFESLEGGGSGAAVVAKFRQTTYWSCVTWPSTVHCGWHEPILDASMNSGDRRSSEKPAIWARFTAVVAVGLILGT
ncbi:hypothetical protein JX265_013926 [Neoarthrinium moseri]|uniref:Uncharacterized protein n=1 Tax=Neoarthrinium moseri TaxID=1658444 RepID=A0A9P9W7K1_9PEZI|nr:uncharacterized protein JN550_002910 [Neoarthrinium moseri]KAI1847683.1 hypothetical protein JX265_013926 [Neoarthrinium moseri]KAI1874331.1 hypothetical protein JN550_002910 [Neoarthrinium moseri]